VPQDPPDASDLVIRLVHTAVVSQQCSNRTSSARDTCVTGRFGVSLLTARFRAMPLV